MFNQPLTKRQLGFLLLISGTLGFIAIFAIDVIDVGREGGIGPAQQIALGVTLFLAFVGLTLLPFKNTLA